MSGRPCYRGTRDFTQVRFTLVGFVACPGFQESLAIIEHLHKKYPNRFLEPFIRPMLEIDWLDYLKKAQRRYGKKLWNLQKPFIIYSNDKQMGIEIELKNYLAKWYQVRLTKDYHCLGRLGVVDMYDKYMELGRRFAYFTIAINDRIIGTLIFMLYFDIAPKTCETFMRRTLSKEHGFCCTRVHRIMKSSWIQCGDFKLPIRSRSNENYVVPHNRRGVLSMCNNNPHCDNTSQFFITLESTPWMDYKYVALGQLMQGEDVLHQLEMQPTTYEYPVNKIVIVKCGDINLEDTLMAKHRLQVHKYLADRGSKSSLDVIDIRDAPSILLATNYYKWLYAHPDDDRPHLPMRNIPSSLLTTASLSTFIRSYSLEEAEDEGTYEMDYAASYILTDNNLVLDETQSVASSPTGKYLEDLVKKSEPHVVVDDTAQQPASDEENEFEGFDNFLDVVANEMTANDEEPDVIPEEEEVVVAEAVPAEEIQPATEEAAPVTQETPAENPASEE